MKKILILGGTQFIGRNLVEELNKKKQYELTLFNRQKTGAALFPEVNKIKGDRESQDIAQIQCQEWDYIVDLSCYYPEALENTLSHLPKSVKKYILMSSCSAYDNLLNKQPLKTENTSLLPCSELQCVDRTPNSYGNRKAECERVLSQSNVSSVILRPALVYGRFDVTDRFYYWLHQVNFKKKLMLPDLGIRHFSTTYVKDLVGFIIRVIERRAVCGAYNVITTPETSIRQLVEEAAIQLKKNPEICNASGKFLSQNNVSEWTDMPLWIDGNHFTFCNSKLLAETGIRLTQFQQSVKETINHFQSQNWPIPNYGISAQRRIELLKLLEIQA